MIWVLLIGDSLGIKSSGFKVTSTPDFLTGIEAIKEKLCDLVIIDSQLEGAKKACQFFRTRFDIPVILLLPNSQQPDWGELLPFEADAFLSAGINGKELEARLKAIFRRCKNHPIPLPSRDLMQIRHHSDPELVSGVSESEEMLKQVQHDKSLREKGKNSLSPGGRGSG